MAFHFIVRFEPREGMADEFREAMRRVATPTREEPGCLRADIFESVHEPRTFAIHSVWRDEAAFDLHTTLPHTVAFIEAADRLLTHPIQGMRLQSAD